MWVEINTSTANSSWLPVSSYWSVRPAASTSGSLSVWWGGLLAKWRTVCRPAMIGKEPVWPGWRGVLARHFPYNWPDLRASRADCEPVLCAVVAAQKGGIPVRLLYRMISVQCGSRLAQLLLPGRRLSAGSAQSSELNILVG